LGVSIGDRPFGDSKLVKIVPAVVFFVVGGLLLLGGAMLVLHVDASSDGVKFFLGLLLCLFWFLAADGWPWLSQYRFGSYGSLMKHMCVLVIGLTVIGLVPFAYWLGRGVFKRAAKLAGFS